MQHNGTTLSEIERQFLVAIQCCDALPDHEIRYFHVRCAWPLSPREWFAYSPDPDEASEPRYVPSPHDLAVMLDTLAWGRTLGRLEWRICRDVASGFSRASVADRLRLPVAEVADRYQAAISEVCRAARAAKAA